ADARLDVNGQLFDLTSSPQTVTLTGLDSDGATVNVTAKFSNQEDCSRTFNELFTAPANCLPTNCLQIMSTHDPIIINEEDRGTYVSVINYTENKAIEDININDLVIQHSWVSDLVMSLTSPEGTTVQLYNSVDCQDDNISINLDDRHEASFDCPPNGNYNPIEALAEFNGQNSKGNWTLTVVDGAAGDGGQIDSWSLQICGDEQPLPQCNITSLIAGEQSACDPDKDSYSQEVIIEYNNAPITGQLVVNNQTFSISGSPQTILLDGLQADGQPVNVSASFSDETTCEVSTNSVFIASPSCKTAPDDCGDYNLNVAGMSDGIYSSDNQMLLRGSISANANLIFNAQNGFEIQQEFQIDASSNVQFVIKPCSN
ncbi:MAG: proprotein convertase P-domain-containing protein, partial [Bacteroidota bacterium]